MSDPLAPLVAALDQADSLPFLFVGSGVSRRYLGHENFHDLLAWAADLTEHPLPYYLAKGGGQLPKAASEIANAFFEIWWNEMKYLKARAKWEKYSTETNTPLKLMVAERLGKAKLVQSRALRNELKLLGTCQIDGIITTNYDSLLEDTFPDYEVLVGQQDLLLSRSYQLGEIYKIHGSIREPKDIVLCQEDYEQFADTSAYLVAKLMSVFVEHPIVFLGYSLQDENIRVVFTSLLKCLSKDRIQEFKDRFIWIDYDEAATTPVVGDHLIDLGDTRMLPVLRVQTASFAPVFEVLSKLERAVPLGLLRRVAQNVVEIVHSTNPTRFLSVASLQEIADVTDKTLIVGVAPAPGSISFKSWDRYDVIADLIVPNPGFADHKQVVLELLPSILKLHPTGWMPVFKHVELSQLPDNEIPDPVKKLMAKVLKPLHTTVPPNVATSTPEELVTQYGLAKALGLVRSMSDADIDIDLLEALMLAHVGELKTADGALKTAFGQASVRLDRLRHGPGALKKPASKKVKLKIVGGGSRTTKPSTRAAAAEPTAAEIRTWAVANGLAVSPIGRISTSVRDAYVAARPPAKT